MILSWPRMLRAVVISVMRIDVSLDVGFYHLCVCVECKSPTHIILAQMDALAAHGEGHIHSIIDQQWDIVSFRDLVKLPRGGNEYAGIAGLVSVLHDSYATTDCLVDDVTEVPAAQNGGRGVCDEVETVVDLFRCRAEKRRGFLHGTMVEGFNLGYTCYTSEKKERKKDCMHASIWVWVLKSQAVDCCGP